MESDHIVGVHDMIIHNYGAGRSIASLHAEVPSDSDFVAVHEEIDEAEKRVWQQTGVYLVIHMDPIDINNAYVNALREQTDGVLRQIDGQLTMHDFRIVDGKRQINLIFDVVVPFSYDEDAKRDLLMKIYDGLKAIDSRYNPVVTLDLRAFLHHQRSQALRRHIYDNQNQRRPQTRRPAGGGRGVLRSK